LADVAEIRLLNADDPQIISNAFKMIGSGKPVAQYQKYLVEQAEGRRLSLVAFVDNRFVGYVTVNWFPSYCGSVELNVPEIQDLNVLPEFRGRGIGTLLLDRAEGEVGLRFSMVAIGVGLHPGYNNAQKLYIKRGYVPDGRGVTYRDRCVEEGTQIVLDDDFILHLTKCLRRLR
jgi:GNAT superfamily N-acetyltransferase